MQGDVADAAKPELDDASWTKVTLPHSFNAAETRDGSYYRGPVWYRRAFTVAAVTRGRRLFIQFDAAATAADVWLNGKKVGRHEGGQAAFRFDLSEAIVAGRNLLAVRVDNSETDYITPLGGDFTLFGGLTRPVSLIETDDVHFDMMDFGGSGIYAHVSRIDDTGASITVLARVANDDTIRRSVTVTSRITDAQGQQIAEMRGSADLIAGATGVIRLEGSVPSPHRWDGVRDPYLYHIVSRIGDQGDQVTVPLGIREFRIDPAAGLILNGQHYPIHGTNVQASARPGIGTAVSDAQVAEDFRIIREMGATGVRLVHFQHPQATYDATDRLGLGTWTEIGVNGRIEDTAAFKANAAQQLRELIAQTYNHPSVLLWGIGNEVYDDNPSVAGVLESLQRVAREADPSRPTVYAHCCQADDHPKTRVSDVIGFNRYYGWYGDQSGATMDGWARGFHAAFPDRAFAVSEYGAGASIHHQADPPGAVDPGSGWHPEQYQTEYHERNWREIRDKPYIFASFVWVAFDFASAGRHEGDLRGINDKGLVSDDRQTRKDAYFWYQANWADKPMLHITSRRFDERSASEVGVKVYTNSPGPVTLFHDGVEIGSARADDHIVRWTLALREGTNRIAVRGEGGLTDRVEWRYQPAPSMVPAARP